MSTATLARDLEAPMRRTVSVDFDGVIHAYTSPWIAPHIIPDPPVRGAIAWLWKTLQSFDVQILSTRAHTWRGRRAIRRWLKKHAGNLYYDVEGYRGIEYVNITDRKGPALIYIDDRGHRFDGTFPTKKEIYDLVPWWKEKPSASK